MNQDSKNTQRFEVQLVSGGKVVAAQGFDSSKSAMFEFHKQATSGFGKAHGIGSYVALRDQTLELEAGCVYEGLGSYRTSFFREKGSQLYQEFANTKIAAPFLIHDKATQPRSIAPSSTPRMVF